MQIGSKKVDLTNDVQKVIAGVLLFIVVAVIWFALPSIVWFLENLIWAGILIFIIMMAVLCRQSIWDGMKQISWELTKKQISSNKLWYMYRYYDPYLLTKIAGLNDSITSVAAVLQKLTRRGLELQKQIKDNSTQAIAYSEKGDSDSIRLAVRNLNNKVAIDTKQLEALTPKIVNTEKQLKFLQELHDLWKADAEDLKYSLDATAQDYELMKELSKASGNAQSFLTGNSEEYKLYQESIKQIENSVSLYTANFEQFERQAKPIIENLSLAREVSEDAGAKLIQQFKEGSVSLKIEH